ncbi:hypothetical protein CC2G_015237 [Coprinopsis cinerea AmutBmut pab1-1]|nr:hypothetical protein CC2G_015237 [Coprinopsis cinerea AmutBmut pab1-1]
MGIPDIKVEHPTAATDDKDQVCRQVPVLEVRQRLKTGRWSQQEIEVARRCAEMVRQTADSLGRTVSSLLAHSGLGFHAQRDLNTAQMFSKIAATRPEAPKAKLLDATYNAWCRDEYLKEKANFATEDAFRQYLQQELRRLNLEPDELSATELAAMRSDSHFLALTWSSDPSAAALSSAYTSHTGLEDYCQENKVPIRTAINNFGIILKNADIGGAKLGAICLEDLLGMIFETAIDKPGGASSTSKTEHSATPAATQVTSTSDDSKAPQQQQDTKSQPTNAVGGSRVPDAASNGVTAPVVRRAGVTVDYLNLARQFIKTPWLPDNPWHQRESQKRRDYHRAIVRDSLLMQIAVNTNNRQLRVGDAGKLVIDAKCRWVNYPTGSGVPGFTFTNSSHWWANGVGIQEADVSAIGAALVKAC